MADDGDKKTFSFVAPISQAVIAMVAIVVPVVTFVWFIMSEATGMKLNAQEIEFTYENLSHDFADLSHDFDLFAMKTEDTVNSNAVLIKANAESIDELIQSMMEISVQVNANAEVIDGLRQDTMGIATQVSSNAEAIHGLNDLLVKFYCATDEGKQNINLCP